MPKYMVKIEDRGFSWDVDVEAANIEEAVAITERDHCQPRMVEVKPKPSWAEPYPEDAEEGTEVYELTHEILDKCADCGIALFSRGGQVSKGWPWSYDSGDEGSYTTICYPCAMKRKEAGNYCPDCGAYYSKHYCPRTGKDTRDD